MTPKTFRHRRIAAAVAAACTLAAGQAWGAAFALQENSGSGLGNAYAGGAAFTEDASSMWSNAATLSKRGSMEAAAALHLITPSIKFRDDGSLPALNQPLGGNGGDAGGTNVVPNAYFALPINKQWTFGIGINAPFGLKTEYDDGWLGRYQALLSDVKTINVNPAFSFKVNDMVSIGVGANWQHLEGEFTNNVNYSAAIAQAASQAAAGGLITPAQAGLIVGSTPGLDSKAKVDGDDDSWGWNIGILFDLSQNTRIGASYRSSIKHTLKGNASFDNPTVTVSPALQPVVDQLTAGINTNALYNSGITSKIELPEIANVSIFHRLSDRWDVMADVQYTGWSSIEELRFDRTTGALLSSTPENFDDAWRISVGANYRHNDRWMFRGGIAWDQTPVVYVDRTPRLPDEDRWWFSFGAQYKWSKNLKVDAGFTYISADKAQIVQNAGSTNANGLISGHYDADVTIFSFQGTYTF